MRYLQPIPWRDVRPGTVITDGCRTPRTVIANDEVRPGVRLVLLEGLPPLPVYAHEHAEIVELDIADAVGAFHSAGFTVTPIEGNGS